MLTLRLREVRLSSFYHEQDRKNSEYFPFSCHRALSSSPHPTMEANVGNEESGKTGQSSHQIDLILQIRPQTHCSVHPSLDWNADTGSRPVFGDQTVPNLCVQILTSVQIT